DTGGTCRHVATSVPSPRRALVHASPRPRASVHKHPIHAHLVHATSAAATLRTPPPAATPLLACPEPRRTGTRREPSRGPAGRRQKNDLLANALAKKSGLTVCFLRGRLVW